MNVRNLNLIGYKEVVSLNFTKIHSKISTIGTNNMKFSRSLHIYGTSCDDLVY